MDFKFIVLALVISVARGEEDKKFESPLIRTNTSISSNKNEGLLNPKHDVTSKKTEKLTHDIENVNVGIPKDDLSRKPVADMHMSTVESDMANAPPQTPPILVPTPAPTSSTTSAPTSTTTSAPTSSTTSAPTSTTTSAPTSSTTSAPTSTTTSAPTSTTTSAPITTTTPAHSPGPEEGKWVVNQTNSVCIVMQMEIEFNVSYPGSQSSVYNKTIYVPKNANATGNCSQSVQDISLKWGFGNVFNISFASNGTTGKFHISSLNLTVNTTAFENIRRGVENLTYNSANPDFPGIPLKMSYKCDKQLKQILRNSDTYNATLLISHTQLQAFMDNKTVFGEVKDCDEFDTPDIVPIAVGSILSILVLIVLVAYLIGRRRSQSRGYLSM